MMMIPLIKVKDKDTGIKHIVGTSFHDQLEIKGNAIHYYNLQCGCGTQYSDACYEFIGNEPTEYEPATTVEMVTVDEYLKLIGMAEKQRLDAKAKLEKLFDGIVIS